MCEKVGLCLFLIRFQGSDEDGAEIQVGGRCSCGRSLRHSNLPASARFKGRSCMFVTVQTKPSIAFPFRDHYASFALILSQISTRISRICIRYLHSLVQITLSVLYFQWHPSSTTMVYPNTGMTKHTPLVNRHLSLLPLASSHASHGWNDFSLPATPKATRRQPPQAPSSHTARHWHGGLTT